MQTLFTQVLHTVGHIVLVPCLIVLILLIVIALIEIGDVFMEWMLKRRKYEKNIVTLIMEIQRISEKGNTEKVRAIIQKSKLLKRQKEAIEEILESVETGASKPSVLATAARVISFEEGYYDKQLSVTNLVAKLGPMFGLLGTLIPLGPGIVALGKGDTETLAASIGIAFDTTIAGLLAASIAIVISGIRKRWYNDYMSTLDTILECIIEEVAVS